MEPAQMDPMAAAALGGGMIFFILLITSAIYVALFWPIFKKTHGNGKLSLIGLIPILGAMVCIVWLALGRWPNIDGGDRA
jgi:hypothetical protein